MQLHYCINAIRFIAAIKKSSRKLQGLTKSKLPRKKKNRLLDKVHRGQFCNLVTWRISAVLLEVGEMVFNLPNCAFHTHKN